MAAAAVTCKLVLEQSPGITVGELAQKSVADHIRTNGCEFAPYAAERALALLGLEGSEPASLLPPATIAALGEMLEGFETNCQHKAG